MNKWRTQREQCPIIYRKKIQAITITLDGSLDPISVDIADTECRTQRNQGTELEASSVLNSMPSARSATQPAEKENPSALSTHEPCILQEFQPAR